MSLPLPVIERLFDRLASTYGTDFTNRYVGEVSKVKSIWAYELSGFETNLKAIAYGLENLPERAPNIIEFRNLCSKAPEVTPVMLDRPKADPKIVAMIKEGLKPIGRADRLDWARAILANQEGRTPTVVQMAKNALGDV